MAVVAAWRTGPTALLAAGAGWFGGGKDGSLVRRVSRGGFRLAAKELAFTQPELGADVFEFVLKFCQTGASALMHGLPVTSLLAELEVFGEQRAGVAAWQGERVCTLELWGRQREWTRVRCNVHTTSMIGKQLQGEVSRRRKTRLPKSYNCMPFGPLALSPASPYWTKFRRMMSAERGHEGNALLSRRFG